MKLNTKILFIFLIIFIVIIIIKLWIWHEGELGDKDLTISTSKQTYEYGEPVEIEVIRNFPSVENNKRYGKSHVSYCGLYISSKDNDLFYKILDCSNMNSCKYYCDQFLFNTEKFEPKKIVWDQKACFGTSWYGDPISAGDYMINIICPVTFTDGEWIHTSIAGNGVNIKIKEPPITSCANKKGLKVNKITYGNENNVVLEIENNSLTDIENIGIKKICLRTVVTDSMKDAVLEGIKAGEKKNYSFDHSCTDLNSFKIYPYECLSDRDIKYYEFKVN